MLHAVVLPPPDDGLKDLLAHVTRVLFGLGIVGLAQPIHVGLERTHQFEAFVARKAGIFDRVIVSIFVLLALADVFEVVLLTVFTFESVLFWLSNLVLGKKMQTKMSLVFAKEGTIVTFNVFGLLLVLHPLLEVTEGGGAANHAFVLGQSQAVGGSAMFGQVIDALESVVAAFGLLRGIIELVAGLHVHLEGSENLFIAADHELVAFGLLFVSDLFVGGVDKLIVKFCVTALQTLTVHLSSVLGLSRNSANFFTRRRLRHLSSLIAFFSGSVVGGDGLGRQRFDFDDGVTLDAPEGFLMGFKVGPCMKVGFAAGIFVLI